MRLLFSALFLLSYLAIAGFVIALVLSNTHEIAVHTIVAGEHNYPLYLPVAVAFFAGIALAILSMCIHRIGQRFSKHI